MAVFGIIITGTAGFIGINFIKHIGDTYQADFVICVDKLGYATQYNTKVYETLCNTNHLHRADCDINDPIKLKSLYDLSGDCWATDWIIIDFASNSHVDKSISNPGELYNENCTIPSNLMTWIGKENWCDINHYFHISTDEVYGDIPISDKEDTRRYFSPMSALKPSNPYSASKVAQDMYLSSIHRTFGVPITIFRMANQFGPYQHPEKMLPASILRALRGETIKIYGDGKNCRQWTFVEDTVDAIHTITSNNRESLFDPPIIHLADSKNLIDNNTLVQKVCQSLTRYNINTKIEYVTDRLGHDAMYALKVDEVDQHYFKTPFDVALDKTVDFYVEGFKNGSFT